MRAKLRALILLTACLARELGERFRPHPLANRPGWLHGWVAAVAAEDEDGHGQQDDFDEPWESYSDGSSDTDTDPGAREPFLEDESRLLETLVTDLNISMSTYLYETVATAIVRDMGQVRLELATSSTGGI
jgi:hypothetical protein